MKVGIIVFPGSNCDHDTEHVFQDVYGLDTRLVWHKEQHLDNLDLVVVPGGFSYGDYLRAGAIARFSPIMKSVVAYAKEGGLVLGICNGFQVLCECGLLPGALLRNGGLRFACKWVHVRAERSDTAFTNAFDQGQVVSFPIAHGEGNYFASRETLETLEEEGRVVFRYCDEVGVITPQSNPNGSANNIAGIVNRRGNVLGMMPHPERCADEKLGGADGKLLFDSFLHYGLVAAIV